MTLAAIMSEDHRWLTPHQLEEAQIADGDQRLSFDDWFRTVFEKKRKADASPTGEIKLTDVEKRGYEVGSRLIHYKAVRDRTMLRSVEPMMVMPRPSNKAYLDFLAQTYKKAQKTQSIEGLAPLELDGAKALDTYWNEFPIDERKVPGTDESFDGPFSEWLAQSSAWVPLKAMLDTKPEALAEAGFPLEKVKAFQAAFKALDAAEDRAPGMVPAGRGRHGAGRCDAELGRVGPTR